MSKIQDFIKQDINTNPSLKEEYKKDFEIEKLDIIKGNFNVVKRRSIDLIKTLNKLIGDS